LHRPKVKSSTQTLIDVRKENIWMGIYPKGEKERKENEKKNNMRENGKSVSSWIWLDNDGYEFNTLKSSFTVDLSSFWRS
jgi:hypothetical protein